MLWYLGEHTKRHNYALDFHEEVLFSRPVEAEQLRAQGIPDVDSLISELHADAFSFRRDIVEDRTLRLMLRRLRLERTDMTDIGSGTYTPVMNLTQLVDKFDETEGFKGREDLRTNDNVFFSYFGGRYLNA